MTSIGYSQTEYLMRRHDIVYILHENISNYKDVSAEITKACL